MLGVQLAELLDGPLSGVEEALGLVAGFDEVLEHGFARVGPDRAQALTAFAGALDGSPLGGPAAEAVAKVTAGSITEERLSSLAAGRTALLGAVHDALLARSDSALGRSRDLWDGPSADVTDPPPALGAARAWLQELAVVGWRGVGHDLVSTADRTLEALLAEPGLRRQAVLLDGLAAELRASCPVAATDRVPARRWADLWTREVLLTHGSPMLSDDRVSGRLLVLGVDVLEHGTAVQVQVHGVLEPDGGAPRLVRTAVTAAKTDTITGPALWQLLAGHPALLTALAEHRSLELRELRLTAGGDLLWQDEKAVAGEPADPFATARVLLPTATAAPVAPLDRHPVRLAEPVLMEGHRIKGDSWELDGRAIAVETDHLPACGPLTPALLRASTACIGLLHWDAGNWTLRPLAVQAKAKGKPVQAHNGDWALGPTDPKVVRAAARSGDAVAVLRERAGRLLRR